MARPKKDETKTKRTFVRVTEEEREKLYSLARGRGITFSAMLLQDYLQQTPRVTFAPPDREKIIKHLITTTNIITFMDRKLARLNPYGLEIMELVKILTNQQLIEYREIEEMKETALYMFLDFQSELNGRNKG